MHKRMIMLALLALALAILPAASPVQATPQEPIDLVVINNTQLVPSPMLTANVADKGGVACLDRSAPAVTNELTGERLDSKK